jgi:hypothetical protein
MKPIWGFLCMKERGKYPSDASADESLLQSLDHHGLDIFI